MTIGKNKLKKVKQKYNKEIIRKWKVKRCKIHRRRKSKGKKYLLWGVKITVWWEAELIGIVFWGRGAVGLVSIKKA